MSSQGGVFVMRGCFQGVTALSASGDTRREIAVAVVGAAEPASHGARFTPER
jgi:hypothetical protein